MAVEHFYVWYRVEGDVAAARAAVAAMQSELAAQRGVRGRLLRRRDDETTWMEIYEDVPAPDAFAAALGVAAQRHGVTGFAADGKRHVERFVAPD